MRKTAGEKGSREFDSTIKLFRVVLLNTGVRSSKQRSDLDGVVGGPISSIVTMALRLTLRLRRNMFLRGEL